MMRGKERERKAINLLDLFEIVFTHIHIHISFLYDKISILNYLKIYNTSLLNILYLSFLKLNIYC